MLTWRKFIAAFSFCVLLTACGGGSNNSNSVPLPVDPNASPSPRTPGLTATPAVDGGITPYITNAVPVKLADNTTFVGLGEILAASGEQFFAPLVGDPKLRLVIPNTRQSAVSAKLFFSFEDDKGFWGMQQNSFEGAAFQTSSGIDMIFQDSVLVTRVLGFLNSGGKVTGTVTYRVRQPGETQCQVVTADCRCIQTSIFVPCTPPPSCFVPPDTATPCRNYMSGGAAVKTLGSFEAIYSSWVQ